MKNVRILYEDFYCKKHDIEWSNEFFDDCPMCENELLCVFCGHKLLVKNGFCIFCKKSNEVKK